MHADTLYHRMLAQEAEVEKAKDEGRPVPKFSPILATPPTTTTPITAGGTADTATSDTGGAQGQGVVLLPETDMQLTPEQQETLRARLEKVPEEDRAAEAEAIKGEWRAKAEVASRVSNLWKQQELDRRARFEKGEPTMWDRMAGVFNSTTSSSPPPEPASSSAPNASSASESVNPSGGKK